MIKSFIVLFFVISNLAFGQAFTERDKELCNDKFSLSVDKSLNALQLHDVLAEIGISFLGTEYVANTLETAGQEKLVVNFTGLDCTTFLETSFALARCIKKGNTSFDVYQKELEFMRYRNGELNGYPSRLHYFSDWIYDNVNKGIVEDITKNLGGEKIKFSVGFMSRNPDSYKMLKGNDAFIAKMKEFENAINQREYYYIAKSKVNTVESDIQNGDLIAITTNLKGLDISHVGIAVKMKTGKIHFLHAPIAGSKVQITEKPLHEYLAKIKKHTGIIVLRPKEI